MKNSICFVEIPADDLGTLQNFYRDLFGWEYEKMPGDVDYYIVDHGEEKPGAGMLNRQDPGHIPIFYVKVDSVEVSMNKAQEMGAQVLVPKSAVPGMGWYAVLVDPQNNPMGLWQDDETAS